MSKSTIRFGIMADIHQDFMYGAEERLKEFIERMNSEKVDFIIQLGDFCYPTADNRTFLGVWERFEGTRYHVLGNHDMDKCDKRVIMDYLGMKNNYYSFDCGDYHFVVLDTNYLCLDGGYVDYDTGNYFLYPDAINNLSDEQLRWLREDLAATEKHTILFSHQNMESPHNDMHFGIKNSDLLRETIREANETAGFRKVIACMNGHNHMDGVKIIDDVYFIHINSMSYYYLGPEYYAVRYSEDITNRFKLLANTAPYRDALYAIVSLEPGQMAIDGRTTGYVGPTPLEMGHPNTSGGHVVDSRISKRALKF